MVKSHINISNEQDKFPVDKHELEEISCKILQELVSDKEIISLSALNSYNPDKFSLCMDILLCDDARIKEINNTYRGKDKATDVLSFALFADSSEENRIIFNNEIHLGEIIISLETAKKQADENKKSFNEELYFLLSHGILHLLGFDHQDEESYKYMLKLQDVLSKIYM